MYKKFVLRDLLAPSHKYNEDSDVCHICLDLLILPIQCNSCKAKFCKCCADRWRKGGKLCPNRCSQKWEYHETSPLETKLRCPFDCHKLVYPHQFFDHLRACDKAPAEYKAVFTEQELKAKYRCAHNHPLAYISDPKLVLVNSECAGCHLERQVCRSTCQECQRNGEEYRYCCLCRFPKGLTKTCCPVGHKNFYVKPSIRSVTTLCDICSVSVLANGPACIEDKPCDFAICMKCYKDLEDGPSIHLNPNHPSQHIPPHQLGLHEENNGLLMSFPHMMSHVSNSQSSDSYHDNSEDDNEMPNPDLFHL